MAQRFDIVIVGAGHGGAQAAIALRQSKFEGSIALIGDEPELPYERPPLSKEYLAGEKPFERILIRPAVFWADRNVNLILGHRISAVSPAAHVVTTDDGRDIGYEKLIWAAGGAPRRLSCGGHDLMGVHTVRTRRDVDQIMSELDSVNRVVVIGGGYIGLEAAAVLSKFGKEVVLLEALDRVLARVAGEPLSRFYESEHRRHGVDVRLDVVVEEVEGDGTRVTGVRLASGEVVPCELVIVGIGIIPSTQPLIAAGAEGSNGVAVDAQCRTNLPDIFAIGDCALHANVFAGGGHVRVESVQNANDQATVVAKTVVGEGVHYSAVPWFWSNQYDLRLQTVGISMGYDDLVIRGNPVERSFSIVYLREGRVIALDCVNSTKDYVQGRALVHDRVKLGRNELADPSIPLKSWHAPQ